MKILQTLVMAAVVAAVLAVGTLTAFARTVSPTADDVAKQERSQSTSYDPARPPTSYGDR